MQCIKFSRLEPKNNVLSSRLEIYYSGLFELKLQFSGTVVRHIVMSSEVTIVNSDHFT